jgi:arylsulfatase A-like enzyme
MRTDSRQTRLVALVLTVALVGAALAGCSSGGPSHGGSSSHAHDRSPRFATPPPPPRGGGRRAVNPPQAPPPPRGSRPNIVFILTDDLSRDLIPYMPRVKALERRGVTFANYFASDSLCCPSRASIFTGDFPHDTGVYLNAGPHGGIKQFWARGDERHVFNLALYKAGYRTAMMGKYLNGYLESDGRSPVPSTYVPAGWSEWDVAGWGYPEYDYTLNENGHLHRYGEAPRDYLTSVITRRGLRFINRSARSNRPFFLEMATFTPHHPYTPAPRDRHAFPNLKAPEPPSFDVLPTASPDWLSGHRPLRPRQLAVVNRVFRRRARDVLSIDRMLGQIEATLARDHILRNTDIVFSSDNGYHTGEYRLMPGKLTAYDTDIHIPLVIAGSHIPHGVRTGGVAENTDLAKTFAALGHTSMGGDGHSLLPLVDGGPQPRGWRNTALVEHEGPERRTDDPDRQSYDSANPTTYQALRTPQFLYVAYSNGQHELYDLRTDPFELDNLFDNLPLVSKRRLHAELARLHTCHTGSTCWAGEHLPPPFINEVVRESRSHRSSPLSVGAR